jgi:uncharacterized protein involved in exopolysaccharide biosynthesis
MKRSKLYNNLIRALRPAIVRVERKMNKNRKQAQRAIGRYKTTLDNEYVLLRVELEGLEAQIKDAYRMRDRARSGENYWTAAEKNRMPEGYQHP